MIEHHFRTTFKVKKLAKSLTYQHYLALIGSCFTENIGARLHERQFRTNLNPSGIIYNPLSIAVTLQRIAEGHLYQADDLHFHEGKWLSFEHHGSFSDTDQQACLKKINDHFRKAQEFYRQANHLFVSLGTAWVYRYKKSGEVVTNCHKIPQGHFEKSLLSPGEIVGALEGALNVLRQQLPGLNVVLTVSPVRHVRDGIEEDRLSKSVLRYAADQLVNNKAADHYFPAYELLTDDLRDYRFYEKDLVHPNELALDYIWAHFRQACIAGSENEVMGEIEKLNAAVNHRPLFPDTEAHQSFVRKQMEKIGQLEAQHAFLDLSALKDRLKNQSRFWRD